MTLAPISTSGSLQTTALGRRGTDGTTEFTLQQTAGLNLQTFIWQPWFARVDGDVDIAYDKTFADQSGTARRASGGATLSVLPLSNFPATLSLSHLDSRVSGDFASSDYIRDRVALSARATFSQNLRGGVSASWDRTDTSDSGLLNARTIDFDVNKTFAREDAFLGINSISLGAGYRDSSFVADDPADEDRDRQTALLRLNLRSEPFDDITSDSLLTATYDDLEEDSETFTRLSLQGVSTVQWRPEDKPYIVTGTTRTLTEQISRDGGNDAADSNTLLVAGTLGLRWPVNDRFSFNLGLRGSYEDVDRDEGGALGESNLDDGVRVDATFFAGANYISETRKLSGFDWRWNARAATENGIRSDEGTVTQESIGLGHRFERLFEDAIFVPVHFSFAQDADMRFDANADEPVSAGLSNSITFSYSHSEDATSTHARLFLRDSRDLIGERREFQLIQARLGRRVAIDRDRRLQGDVSAQAAREVDEDESDVFITASGNVSYNHRDLFDIENLALRSELRVNIVNIERLFGTEDEDPNSELLRNDWRNVLTYRIGRLTANLEGTAFQRNRGIGYLALIRLRRDFGGGE